MDDKIRTPLTAVAKVIMSNKEEPYIEVILYDVNDNRKWYDSQLVLRYNLVRQWYNEEPRNFNPISGKAGVDANSKPGYEKVYLYEYERAYLKPSKTVSELKEYRSHNSCPACSSSMCTVKFMTNNEVNKEPSLLCTCERCCYKWLAKPNFVK